MKNYDVIVLGGGIAGSIAAIAAARAGASTLLLEEEGYLGGSLTACGTGPMMTFHAGDDLVVCGLTDELIQRMTKKGLSVGHIVDTTGYTYSVTPFDAEGMKRELECMALEAKVELLYHTTLIAATREGDTVKSITASSCGTQMAFSAKCFIDATGDGDLFVLADIPYVQGRESDGMDQPMTTNVRLDHVDIDAVRDVMKKDISLFPLLMNGKEHLPEKASRLSISGFQQAMQDGMRAGELTFDRDIVLCFETNHRNEVIANMTRVNGENPVDPASLTRAEIEGRRQAWELLAFLKKHIPGFENAEMKFTGPRIGIRSSRRLVGKYCITEQDVLGAAKFEDGIAASGYPIDVHSPDGEETNSIHLEYGQYYTIPYRCLYTDSISNVLAAGRNISSTFQAHASTRVSPICGAIGHAAGIACAMASAESGDVRSVSTDALRAALRKDGARVE